MRLGQNPSKDRLPAYQPPRLGIALLTYVPSLGGYFEHSLEILRFQIASIRHSTVMDFDLLVFDNGSCNETLSELQRLYGDGWIDVLIASRHNLGKIGALNWILGAMPNEFICYADSDVLFRPGWAENSLQILKSFPRAGIVSAQPCFDDVLRGSGKAHLALENDTRFQSESYMLKSSVMDEYAAGVGLDSDRLKTIQNKPSRLVTCRENGVRAVIGATHMQFTIPRSVAQKIVPLPVTYGLGRLEDRNLNLKLDAAGYLHLSTLDAYVWHMGNVPDKKTIDEVQTMGLLEMLSAPSPKPLKTGGWALRVTKRIARIGIFRAMINRLYDFLFKLQAQ